VGKENMATIINNPPENTDSGGAGLIIGIVMAIIIVFLFVAYALPALRKNNNNSGTTINVPDKVDVNVNKTQ
jgi:hypothetical protein